MLEFFILLCLLWSFLKLLIRIVLIILLNMGIRNGILSVEVPLQFFQGNVKLEQYITFGFTTSYIITFSIWLFIKYKKSHKNSRFRLTYKPIWAMFSLVIPVFNLVAPYQIMNEIYSVNNDALSVEKSGKNIIKTWWFLGIAIFIYSRIINSWFSKQGGIENFLHLEYNSLVICALSVHYYYLIKKILSFFED